MWTLDGREDMVGCEWVSIIQRERGGGDSHNFKEVKYERRKTPRINAHKIRSPTKACDGH
jgi:hypothetical protein